MELQGHEKRSYKPTHMNLQSLLILTLRYHNTIFPLGQDFQKRSVFV